MITIRIRIHFGDGIGRYSIAAHPIVDLIKSKSIQLHSTSIRKHNKQHIIIMGRFAERRQERRENRQENRQDRRSSRHGSIKSSVKSSCSSKSSHSSHKSSHSSHRSSCKSSFSSSCSSNGSHTSHGDDGNNTFVMREKLLTFGKDFEIKEATHRRGGKLGGTAFYADNKVLRARETFNLRESRHGEILYQIQERKLRARDAMKIEDGDGEKVAEIKKLAVGVVRDNYLVKVRGDRDWQVHGAILDHDFTIKEGGKTIVKVHKNWVTPIKDCYFIDIDEDCDDKALALIVVIGLEAMSEEE